MFWLRRYRPKEPSTWRDDVRDAEKRASAWARGAITIKPEDVFDAALWSAHKRTFSKAQYAKCAYCELSIAPDADGGTIDHYRPKAKITKLRADPSTWGDEADGHNSRHPGKPRLTDPACSGKGYWWLAYAWDNYLLACSTRNEKWKGTLFPIEGGHSRKPTQKSCAAERPLLLNPYGDVDPTDHLEFDKIGIVTPKGDSAMGFETIRTCGLDRTSLQSQREIVAQIAWPFITNVLEELGQVGRAGSDEGRLRRAIQSLLTLGSRKAPHAGMVRILWSQRDTYGIPWKKLRALAKRLGAPPPVT